MASPLRFQSHGKPHFQMIAWLAIYSSQTPGVEGADNTTVRLDSDTEVQPDGLLRIDANLGGQSSLSEDDYIEGAPELIVEVAASSAAYDLYDKLKVYRRNQVREYLIWQPREHQFILYGLKSGKYLQFEANAEGIICSEVFPGLWLDFSALLSDNFVKFLEILQAGLNSPEHSEFVNQLP